MSFRKAVPNIRGAKAPGSKPGLRVELVGQFYDGTEMPLPVFGSKSSHMVVLAETPCAFFRGNILKALIIPATRLEHPVQMEKRIGDVAGNVLHHMRMDDDVILGGGLCIKIAEIKPYDILYKAIAFRIDVGTDIISRRHELVQIPVETSLRRKVQNLRVRPEVDFLQIHPQKARALNRAAAGASDLLAGLHVLELRAPAEIAFDFRCSFHISLASNPF